MNSTIMQQILTRYITYCEKDVYSINHMLKVYSFARNIAIQEGIEGDLLNIIEASSILHDIGIKESMKKYNRPQTGQLIQSIGRQQQKKGIEH